MRKALLIADTPGWAFDTAAQTIKRHSDEFQWSVEIDYVKRLRRKGAEADLSGYDVVYWFLWYDAYCIGPRIKGFNRSKTCLGVHSHVSWSKRNLSISDTRKILSEFPLVGVSSRKLHAEIDLGNVVVTPNGVDPDNFRLRKLPRSSDGPLKLMWVGNPDVSHHGDNKAFNSIIMPVVSQFPEEEVSLLAATPDNFIPYEKMGEFYSQGEILLCTSSSEGDPYPVLEAMHVGRPVISTDVGIVPEVVNRKNGWIIERNRSSLRGAIMGAIEKRPMIRKMGINAHKSIKGKRNGRIKASSIFDMFNSYLEGKL